MINKQARSRHLLNKTSLGATVARLDELLAKSRGDSKTFFDESSLAEGNDSTTIGKHTNDDTVSIRGSPSMLVALSSNKSYIKVDTTLPFLSVKHSVSKKSPLDFSREISRNLSPSNLLKNPSKETTGNGSPTFFGKLLSKGGNSPTFYRSRTKKWSDSKRHERVVINKNEDFSTPYFLKKLKQTFSLNIHKETKTLAYINNLRKSLSIAHAKRIINALEQELRSLKRPDQDSFAATQNFIESLQQLNEQHTYIEDLDIAVTEILNILGDAIEDVKVKNRLENHMKDIVEIAMQSNNAELLLYCVYTQAKTAMSRNEFNDAIAYFKHYKNLCKSRRVFQNRIFAFKNIGKCYQNLKNYKTALTYYTKFLQMAWYLKNTKYELLAYDLIGKQYFYLGDVSKATAFHKKMTSAKLEPQGSGLQQIAFYKITLRKDVHHTSFQSNAAIPMGRPQKRKSSEDQEEDSSIDEAVELPTPPPEELESDRDLTKDRKSAPVDGQKLKQLLDKKIVAKKNSDRFYEGLKKVVMIKNREDRNARFDCFPKKASLDHGQYKKSEEEIQKERSKKFEEKARPAALLNTKVSDPILVSHLSRNRNLKNFSATLSKDMSFEEQNSNDDLHVTLGASTDERVKLVLEKFRINLRLIKESLKIFEVQEGDLSPSNIKKKTKKNERTPGGTRKPFFPLGFPCKTEI